MERQVIKTIVRRLPFSPMMLLKSGIVGGVLVAAAALGWMAPRLGRPEVLAAAGVVPLIVVALYRLGRIEYGILGIVLTAGLVRFSLGTGTESRIVASLIVALAMVGLWLANMLVVDKRLWLKPALTNKPLLAFIFVSGVSYVWSLAFRDPLVVTWPTFPVIQLAAVVLLILLPGVFLLVSNQLEEVRWLKWLGGLIIALGAASIVSYVMGLPIWRIFMTHGIFPTWVVSLAYAYALFDERLGVGRRVLLLGLAGLWVYWVFVRGISWISGWLPVLCSVVVISFLRSKKLFIVVVVLGLAFLAIRFDHFYQQIVVQSEQEGDFERWDLWKTSLRFVVKHPLFGTGPGGYVVYYKTYHRQDRRTSHNNYLDILAQTGLIGFAMYLWFFAALVWTGYGLSRRLAGQRNFEAAFANGILGGCVGAIASMMLGDWIIPFVYNQTIMGFDHSVYAWVLMGAMVSLYHIVTEQESAACYERRRRRTSYDSRRTSH